jgi:hypothetical protein
LSHCCSSYEILGDAIDEKRLAVSKWDPIAEKMGEKTCWLEREYVVYRG